ncbi:MAG: hypothetical protein M3Y21_03935 [Candidatus Eremiobacteraeota bacterium]|nr:hypothetical protein [Candidatus Eremiobacteraeota bacterium]
MDYQIYFRDIILAGVAYIAVSAVLFRVIQSSVTFAKIEYWMHMALVAFFLVLILIYLNESSSTMWFQGVVVLLLLGSAIIEHFTGQNLSTFVRKQVGRLRR